jgi:hypothetical protein
VCLPLRAGAAGGPIRAAAPIEGHGGEGHGGGYGGCPRDEDEGERGGAGWVSKQGAEHSQRRARGGEEAPAADPCSPPHADDLASVCIAERVVGEPVKCMGAARQAIEPVREGWQNVGHGARARSTTAVP